jgi:recombinational DNA repair ATPase RecF
MKILSLKIKNIRGIKSIKVKPEGQNVVVFGPNGTGKSAIVDAVDFLLTGRISRLTGEGTKLLRLKKHGCHIDSRDDLENTVVIAKVEVEGKEVKMERSIKKPSSLKIKPKEDKPLVSSCLEVAELGQQVLSRREILRYITAEAGKRAKEIQSLLNLENIEKLRAVLVATKNEADGDLKNAESNLEIARSGISNLLSLKGFSEKTSLDKVNEFRAILDGAKIDELSPEKIKQNLTPQPFGIPRDALTKAQIQNIIGEVRKLVKAKGEVLNKESELKTLLDEVAKEAKLKQYLTYRKLFEAGIRLVDESNVCPLCGRTWEEGDFREFLEERVKETSLGEEKEEQINKTSTFIKRKVDLLKNYVNDLFKAHKQFKLEVFSEKEFDEYSSLLDFWSGFMIKPLESFEADKWPSLSLQDMLRAPLLKKQILAPLEKTLKKVGEQLSQQQNAWDTLTKMEDQWKLYQKALERKEAEEKLEKRAEAALSYFEDARDSVLEEIYDAVKDNFNEYYRTIHSEDEGRFDSKISHEKAELTFEVDFYGRGMFPPHALHSEGHQDSMGLCLFLALNKYLTKDVIKTIVLDDVIMSIDRTHRRAVCHLLKKVFPDKQFIITTHDTAWARQLKAEGIVTQKNMIHFVNWNIDTGPIFELDKDLWARIKEDLDEDDVPSAAHKLRRDAEYFFENICGSLRAKNLLYRGDHRWELGEYAPAAISTYKEYLRKAKSNFQKMNQQDKLDELKEFEKRVNEIIVKSQIEQWIINENVHYNRWGEFDRKDFEPVVEAFKNLFALFSCSSCGATIAVSERKGKSPKTIVSCSCGEIFLPIKL